jgi:hypothetical protein
MEPLHVTRSICMLCYKMAINLNVQFIHFSFFTAVIKHIPALHFCQLMECDSNPELIKIWCLTYTFIFITPYWQLSCGFQLFLCLLLTEISLQPVAVIIGKHKESTHHLDMSYKWFVIEQWGSCKFAIASYYNTANTSKMYEEYCLNKTDIMINNSSLQAWLWKDIF